MPLSFDFVQCYYCHRKPTKRRVITMAVDDKRVRGLCLVVLACDGCISSGRAKQAAWGGMAAMVFGRSHG